MGRNTKILGTGVAIALLALALSACVPTVPDLPLAGRDLPPPAVGETGAITGTIRCSDPYPRTMRIQATLAGAANSLTVSLGPTFAQAVPMHPFSGTTWRSDPMQYTAANTQPYGGGFLLRFDVESTGGTHRVSDQQTLWVLACVP